MHQYMNLCPPDCPCLLHPLCIVWWKAGCPRMSVCLCPKSAKFCSNTLLRMLHVSVLDFMSTWLSMSVPPPMYSYMETWVSKCGTVCCRHPTSVPTPWLECVYASVHVCMSTWLPISPQTSMHIYMETWILLYGTVFVYQSTHLCSHTLFRMCAYISPCTSVHSTPHVSSMPYW